MVLVPSLLKVWHEQKAKVCTGTNEKKAKMCTGTSEQKAKVCVYIYYIT